MPLALPDPPLAAERFVLRPFRPDDAADVVAACADPDIVRFTFMQQGLTEEGALAWIDRVNEHWAKGHPRFAIAARDDDRVLGQVGIALDEQRNSAEGYYWVAPGARRRGIATDALALVAGWAFDHGIERLVLLIEPDNDASSRLAAKLGFTREGVLRSYEPFKGGRPDLVSWSLLPSDPRPWAR